MRSLLTLILVILASVAYANDDRGLVLGEFKFATGSSVLSDRQNTDTLRMIASTLALFGNRRDVSLVLSVSRDHLVGTLAAERRGSIIARLGEFEPGASDVVVELDFLSDQSPDLASLAIVPNPNVSAFCPWTIQAQLNGWSEAIRFAAGIERRLPQSPSLALRFKANAEVPYSKSLVECGHDFSIPNGEHSGARSSCTVFLISSVDPIRPITLREIRSALLRHGKGTGSALLPTSLSGSLICEIGLSAPAK